MENNLVVLDPDHPLMVRFQKRLNEHLLKRDERLTLEIRETKHQLDVIHLKAHFNDRHSFIFSFLFG